jgi:hypothetical protein
MGDSRVKDISTLLSSFFDKDKLQRGERYSEFFSSWPALVGPRLAAHSHVADVDKGLLVVEAEHPGWIQLLQMRQSGILEDVARRYPELRLRGIVFRLSGQGSARRAPLAGVAAEETDSAPGAEAIGPAPDADTGAEKGAKDIEDPEFQALFSSLKKTMQDKG